MQSSQTILNQTGSDATVAVGAAASRSELGLPGLGLGQALRVPSVSAVANPATLSACCSNPDASASVAMSDGQGPLGVEFVNLVVADNATDEGVHDNEIVFAQNQFGSNPEQSCCGTDGCCGSNIEAGVAVSARVEEGLSQEQAVEHNGDGAPNQVAHGAKHNNVLHVSIIAGAPAAEKGK